MKNNHWIRYVYKGLKHRDLIEDKPFYWSFTPNSSDYAPIQRETTRLINKKDMFLDNIRIQESQQINKFFHKNIFETLLDTDKNIDACFLDLYDCFSDSNRTYLGIGLEREIFEHKLLNSGNPLSINSISMEFKNKNCSINEKIYFGKDFSVLQDYGTFSESQDPFETILNICLSIDPIKKSPLASNDPYTSADNFLEYISKIKYCLSKKI